MARRTSTNRCERVGAAARTAAGAAALASLLTTGCLVSRARLDEAEAARANESAARQASEAEVETLRARLVALDATVAAAAAERRRQEERLAEQQLVMDRCSATERDATELGEQVREELGRVGNLARALRTERDALQAELVPARERVAELEALARAEGELMELVSALTATLAEPLRERVLTLDVRGARPALTLPSDAVFTANGRLAPSISPVLAGVAAVAKSRPVVLVLSETGPSAARLERLGRLAQALEAAGLPAAQVSLSLADAPEPGAAPSAEASAAGSQAVTERAAGDAIRNAAPVASVVLRFAPAPAS